MFLECLLMVSGAARTSKSVVLHKENIGFQRIAFSLSSPSEVDFWYQKASQNRWKIETKIDQKTKLEKVSSEVDFGGQKWAKIEAKIDEKSIRKCGWEFEGKKVARIADVMSPGGRCKLRRSQKLEFGFGFRFRFRRIWWTFRRLRYLASKMLADLIASRIPPG